MKKKMIIVSDLGLLRAYQVVQGPADRKPHLELVDELRPDAAHEKLSEQVTDQAGRFPGGGGANGVSGDVSGGENHELMAEIDRRLVGLLAARINALLSDDSVVSCSLAASAPIHRQVLDAIKPRARAKIDCVLASNLAGTAPAEIPRHFARVQTQTT